MTDKPKPKPKRPDNFISAAEARNGADAVRAVRDFEKTLKAIYSEITRLKDKGMTSLIVSRTSQSEAAQRKSRGRKP